MCSVSTLEGEVKRLFARVMRWYAEDAERFEFAYYGLGVIVVPVKKQDVQGDE